MHNDYKITAKKSLWQNFLEDENICAQIVWAQGIKWENIVEVGPWYGILSERIIYKNPRSFQLIELDDRLIPILQNRIQEENWVNFCKNIELLHQDVLQYNNLPADKYRLIANIPYYITSPILHHFLYTLEFIPISMTILMQKDVADKILKQYHLKKPKSSVLSLYLAKKTDAQKICDVPARSFFPAPKVDSSVMYFKKNIKYPELDDDIFLKFIKSSFGEPRKKLFSNLMKASYDKNLLEKIFFRLQIDNYSRPEDLDIHKYCKLIKELVS